MSDIARLQKIANDMITFKEETIKLCKRKGNLFPADDLILAEAKEDSIVETSSLGGIKDLSFFTAAPVYVAAKVPYSFLEQYSGEVDKDAHFLTFEVPAFAEGLDVIEDGVIVGTWNDKLHGMGSEYIQKFSDFMTPQILCRGNDLYGISYQDLFIKDPVLLHKKGSTKEMIKVRVFIPHTRRGYFMPYVDYVTGVLKFMLKPPMEDMSKTLAIAQKARSSKVING